MSTDRFSASPPASRQGGPETGDLPSRGYSHYVLVVLTLMYTFNYLDRYVLTILVVPIQAELGLSDTVMGFLLGPAFASAGVDLRALVRGGASDRQIARVIADTWHRREDRYSQIRASQTLVQPRIEMSYIGG